MLPFGLVGGQDQVPAAGILADPLHHLGKLISLAGVRRFPGRIKCALLGWHALMHALDGKP